jgi:hypothetical protein
MLNCEVAFREITAWHDSPTHTHSETPAAARRTGFLSR